MHQVESLLASVQLPPPSISLRVCGWCCMGSMVALCAAGSGGGDMESVKTELAAIRADVAEQVELLWSAPVRQCGIVWLCETVFDCVLEQFASAKSLSESNMEALRAEVQVRWLCCGCIGGGSWDLRTSSLFVPDAAPL